MNTPGLMKHMSASRDPEATQVRIGKRKPFSIRVDPRRFDRYEMLRGNVVRASEKINYPKSGADYGPRMF